jgi:hypothetical protein
MRQYSFQGGTHAGLKKKPYNAFFLEHVGASDDLIRGANFSWFS